MNPTSPLTIESLAATITAAEREISSLSYHPTKAAHLCAAALALHSLEVSRGIQQLLADGTRSGVPVLMRSLLESTMRLAYLSRQPVIAAASLELTDNIEKRKVLKDHAPSAELLANLELRNKHLRKLGAKPQDFRELLKSLRAENWYVIFSYLSNHTHANLTGLSQRFFSRSPAGTQISMIAKSDSKSDQLYIDGTHQLISISWKAVVSVLREDA